MNTDRIRFWVFFCCLVLGTQSLAQDIYQIGILPSINFNYKLEKGWSANFRTESRQTFKSGQFGKETSPQYQYVLSDFSFLAAKKVGLNSRVAGGYLIRFRNGDLIHRLIQQYTLVQRLNSYRLAHRIVLDQTFSSGQATEFRLRYRLASEIPLNGEAADPREFYLKISNEYLNGVEGKAYDLEIRLVPLLGYIFTPAHKIEIGLDYRVNSFLVRQGDHDFWTSINWYIEI